VHRKEIKRLRRVVDEKGLTLVPLKFYLKRGIIKCELGIAKGKKLFDKRDDIRKRDQKRELEREFRIK
jgi:SsrA-binding protein